MGQPFNMFWGAVLGTVIENSFPHSFQARKRGYVKLLKGVWIYSANSLLVYKSQSVISPLFLFRLFHMLVWNFRLDAAALVFAHLLVYATLFWYFSCQGLSWMPFTVFYIYCITAARNLALFWRFKELHCCYLTCIFISVGEVGILLFLFRFSCVRG